MKIDIADGIKKQIALPDDWVERLEQIAIILKCARRANGMIADAFCPCCGNQYVVWMNTGYYCDNPGCLTPLVGFVPLKRGER
jgi:hypothetical protein